VIDLDELERSFPNLRGDRVDGGKTGNSRGRAACMKGCLERSRAAVMRGAKQASRRKPPPVTLWQPSRSPRGSE
jgi:hypothetical protein